MPDNNGRDAQADGCHNCETDPCPEPEIHAATEQRPCREWTRAPRDTLCEREPRRIIQLFGEVMEFGMKRGDAHGWVWNDEARRHADPANLVARAISNLERGREAIALGEPEAAEQCLSDAANLAMLTYDLMCYYARDLTIGDSVPFYEGEMGRDDHVF